MFAVFQFLIAPVAVVTFFKDLGDAENRQRKRSRTLAILLFSAAASFMAGLLLYLLRDISCKYLGFPIDAVNGLPGFLVEFFRAEVYAWPLVYPFMVFIICGLIFFYMQFVNFLFFWIMFSKNGKRRKFVFAFYLAWCCVSLCLMHLCWGFPFYDAPPPHHDETSAPAETAP